MIAFSIQLDGAPAAGAFILGVLGLIALRLAWKWIR